MKQKEKVVSEVLELNDNDLKTCKAIINVILNKWYVQVYDNKIIDCENFINSNDLFDIVKKYYLDSLNLKDDKAIQKNVLNKCFGYINSEFIKYYINKLNITIKSYQ